MSTQNATPTDRAATHHGERRRGADFRTKVADSTLILVAIAGALSFTHIRDVAVMGGQAVVAAWAYPFIVDLITMSAYRKLKRAQADGQPTGAPWTIMIGGTMFSLAANVIDALAHAPAHASRARLTLCVIIGVWPAVAFICSMLLRHSGQPIAQPPAAERPAARERPSVQPAVQPPTKPTAQPAARATSPAGRPTAVPVQQRPAVQPVTAPPPIPVQPTGQPNPFGDLGPRAAAGELPSAVWAQIGHPIYLEIKSATHRRPTESELQEALTHRVAELVSAGHLPSAVRQPSLSTAKRARSAIEGRYPEVKARVVQPQRQLATAAP